MRNPENAMQRPILRTLKGGPVKRDLLARVLRCQDPDDIRAMDSALRQLARAGKIKWSRANGWYLVKDGAQ